MGANIVNTVVEGLSPRIAKLVQGRSALRILSNLCIGRKSSAMFTIPIDKLGWKGVDGR